MSRRVHFAEGGFYHVYNRGVEKRDTFLDKADHERFLSLLFLGNSTEPVHVQKAAPSGQGRTLTEVLNLDRGEPLVNIIAYCLMPNHFHLLIREQSEGGVSKFMQKLCTGYTMYFNKRYERTGALFQGKFKATHAESDPYLKYLFSYIHLNPIKLVQSDWKEVGIRDIANAEQYLDKYRYSSYLDYKDSNLRPEVRILDLKASPDYFSSVQELEEEMRNWLAFQKESRSDLDFT